MKKWHLTTGGALAALALLLSTLFGAFAGGPVWHRIYGQPLSPKGQQIYKAAAVRGVELNQRYEREQLPPAAASALEHLNLKLGAKLHPRPLATPQPITFTSLVRNYSSRQGAKPLLWVVHDAEMPNVPGLQDLRALAAWFNNPAAQASTQYGTDVDGNTVQMVPVSAKAWHVAYFNRYAIGDELLGYASQTTWPQTQLRAVAQLAAHDLQAAGIPIQRGLVIGCQIIKPGIIEHRELGLCGGGHHDPGTHFPIDQFLGLVREYANGGYHPKPKPRPRCSVKQLQAALNRHGAHLAIDGIEGPRTRAALATHTFKTLGLTTCHR